VSLAVFLTLANATSAALLRLKWTPANILNLVCWRMMNFVVPLLMIETGFDDLFRGELRGLVWVAAAAIVATVATAFLRKAEGMKLHTVKASETRNRALAMARKMGVTLRRIYVVPAGRGHLTNAFAGRASIGLTDNLGKYLNRQEIDFVISHELVHLQQNHGRKQRLETIAIFSAVAILLFWSRQGLCHFRPLFDVLLILVPLAASYFFSRRHEYEADRKAIDFTRNSEAGIRALAGLNLISAAPARCSKFAELFLTHPSLARRAETIGRDGEIPRDRITEILRHAGISMDDS
jgi:Zn-dependent protease with chaperone function